MMVLIFFVVVWVQMYACVRACLYLCMYVQLNEYEYFSGFGSQRQDVDNILDFILSNMSKQFRLISHYAFARICALSLK